MLKTPKKCSFFGCFALFDPSAITPYPRINPLLAVGPDEIAREPGLSSV